MKKLIQLVIATIGLIIDVFGQDDVHGYLSTGPQHGYIGRRVSRNLYPGWMEWSEVDVTFPNGIFANIWDSTEIERRLPETQKGDELDLTLGWRGEVWNDIKMRLSTTLFDLYPKDRWWAGDVAVQSLWFSKEFVFGKHTLRPEIRIEWIAKTVDFGGGALVLLPDITHLWREPLGVRHLVLFNQSTIARDDGFNGPKNNSSGVFYRWDGALNWQISKHWELTLPGATLQVPFHDPRDGRGQTELAYGTYLKFKF